MARIDRVTGGLNPLPPDDVLIGRYYHEGTRFLLTASDRELKRISVLVASGEAMSLPELRRVLCPAAEDIERLCANIAAAYGEYDGSSSGEAITGRFWAALEAADEEQQQPVVSLLSRREPLDS